MSSLADSNLPNIDETRFEFKWLKEVDLPLLYTWIKQPEVARWWYESSLDWPTFQQKYLDKLSNSTVFPFLVYFDKCPIGYIEYYVANKVGDGWWLDQPNGVYGIDVFIGESKKLGRGYGGIFLRKFIDILLTKQELKKSSLTLQPIIFAQYVAMKRSAFIRLDRLPPHLVNHYLWNFKYRDINISQSTYQTLFSNPTKRSIKKRSAWKSASFFSFLIA